MTPLPTMTEQHPEAAEQGPALKPGSIAVTGQTALKGNVTVGGSVRASLALLALAALRPRPVTITGVPVSAHTEQASTLMQIVGCAVKRGQGGEITVTGPAAAADLAHHAAPPDLFNALGRAPAAVYLIPAFLRAHGYAAQPWPQEPLEQVLEIYKEFGDTIETSTVGFSIVAAAASPAVVEITMATREPAPTITAVLRACTGGSRIVLHHPSRAPEVHALHAALKRLGWNGRLGDERLELEPGETPWPTLTWAVPGDELEAAACVCALAATRGSGTVSGVSTRHLTVLRMLLGHAGVRVTLTREQVKVERAIGAPRSGRSGLAFGAGPAPRDLPSQQLALLLPVALGVPGRHRLSDPAFPARLETIARQLRAFGVPVDTVREPGRAVHINSSLLAAPRASLEAADPADAMALVITGLAARGTTRIRRIGHLHHSHPGLLPHLRDLGAQIAGGV